MWDCRTSETYYNSSNFHQKISLSVTDWNTDTTVEIFAGDEGASFSNKTFLEACRDNQKSPKSHIDFQKWSIFYRTPNVGVSCKNQSFEWKIFWPSFLHNRQSDIKPTGETDSRHDSGDRLRLEAALLAPTKNLSGTLGGGEKLIIAIDILLFNASSRFCYRC